MKRNMDLVRALLLAVEEIPHGNYFLSSQFTFEGSPDHEVIGHMTLLNDAGLIDGFQPFNDHATCDRLTWAGQEFLDQCRSDTVWNQAKREIRSKGLSTSLELLKSVLLHIAKQQLGL